MAETSTSQPEATTSAVVFKKKAKGSRTAQLGRRTTGEASDGVSDSGKEGTPAVENDEDDREGTPSNLADLIAMRKLRAAQRNAGIDIEKLNAGPGSGMKKKKRKQQEPDEQEAYGLQKGKGGRLKDDSGDEAEDEQEAMNRKIMKTDNFTHQTGIIDVDKHMMAYIERELKKRRTGANGSNEEVDVDGALASLDPNDELYKVAEKYRTKNKKPIDEGNVATSSAMLSAIPEIDLGIDNRLKNIEETERAKRKLLEAREKARAEGTADRSFGDANYANSRFFRHARAGPSEYETLKAAKIEAGLDDEGSADEEYSAEMEEYFKREGKKKQRQQQRTEMATDDIVAERFKRKGLLNHGRR